MVTRKEIRWLLDEARAGDRAAFAELVVRYRPRIETWAAKRLGEHLRTETTTEDVLQDAFTRAFESIGRFRGDDESSFCRWLSGIAEHVILKAATRRQTRKKLEFHLEPPSLESSSPSRRMRREERFDRLERAVSDLPPDYREVVYLARIEGVQLTEIAQRMNRSHDAVKQLLTRALRKLRTIMEDTESFNLPARKLRREEDDHGTS